MQKVKVPIACRAIGKNQDYTDKNYSHYASAIWSIVRDIQGSPTLVKLLDMRTPEVILIWGPGP